MRLNPAYRNPPSDATPSAHYEYGPFGQTLTEYYSTPEVRQSLGDGGFRFSTKYTDNQTALLYYGYRYYDPEMGRWLNRDPIEEFGGFNLYHFVWNNAINSLDILGASGFANSGMSREQWVEILIMSSLGKYHNVFDLENEGTFLCCKSEMEQMQAVLQDLYDAWEQKRQFREALQATGANPQELAQLGFDVGGAFAYAGEATSSNINAGAAFKTGGTALAAGSIAMEGISLSDNYKRGDGMGMAGDAGDIAATTAALVPGPQQPIMITLSVGNSVVDNVIVPGHKQSLQQDYLDSLVQDARYREQGLGRNLANINTKLQNYDTLNNAFSGMSDQDLLRWIGRKEDRINEWLNQCWGK